MSMIDTSNKKGYVDARNAEKNPQAVMITDVSAPTKKYGSPTMSPMPKAVDNWGGETGHKVDVQRPDYPSEKHAGDYKPLIP